MAAMVDEPTGLTAQTAPGIVFATRADLHEHYKSDWHRYNLKRRTGQLEPVGKASFEARRAAALAMIEESEKGQRVRKGGVGAKKSQARLHHGKRANVAKDAALRSSGVVTRDSQASGYRNASAAGAADLNEDDAVSDDDSDAAAAAAGAAAGPPHEAPPAIDLRDGLFDTFRSESAHASLERMRQKYGFFLPDVEYLTDVDGLLRYLHEKVKYGHTCLYCNKVWPTWRGVQQHMVDVGHCKIAYDAQDDMDEYESFYDFSRSYLADGGDATAEFTTTSKFAHEESKGGDDDEGWSTDDDEGGDGGDGAGAAPAAAARAQYAANPRSKRKVEVLPSGELLVHDGTGKAPKRVGVRWLARYYKQNFRPEDDRAPVVAARLESRNQLLAAYKAAGVETGLALASVGDPGGQLRALRHMALKVNRQGEIDNMKFEKNRQYNWLHTGMKQNLLQKNHLAGSFQIGHQGVGNHG